MLSDFVKRVYPSQLSFNQVMQTVNVAISKVKIFRKFFGLTLLLLRFPYNIRNKFPSSQSQHTSPQPELSNLTLSGRIRNKSSLFF